MKNWMIIIGFLCLANLVSAQQDSIALFLNKYNKNTVPYIQVGTLKEKLHAYVLLDAREKEEFEVSKIGNAKYVGHKKFRFKKIVDLLPKNKQDTIVVYCSIGVRSEQIAEKLKKKGYANVLNLYGGIFQWKNNGEMVLDTANKPTDRVHAYDKIWGKLLHKGKKVYE
ncbi:MAG: rhodanese-like domain-containing protein [Flavobacteriaceae bacterium]|nr:rhodanese-like domain-containing protein [Flavobacteriaceae bacterium]